MKTTLEEIKDQIAKEKGYSNWVQLFNASDYTHLEIHLENAAERYATAAVNAKLQEAEESLKESAANCKRISKQENTNPKLMLELIHKAVAFEVASKIVSSPQIKQQ